MKFLQKKFSNELRFDFQESELDFTVKDKNEIHSTKIKYKDISDDYGTYEEKIVWYGNISFMWIMIGLTSVVYYYINDGVIKGSIWLTFGIINYYIYTLTKTKFTTIQSKKNIILIMKDKQYNTILNEIEKRKKS